MHPNLAELYRRKVERLEEALNDPQIRLQASEIIRTIIDWIEVGPDTAATGDSEKPGDHECGSPGLQKSNMQIVLYGQLAAVMALAEDKNSIDKKGRFSCVAGT